MYLASSKSLLRLQIFKKSFLDITLKNLKCQNYEIENYISTVTSILNIILLFNLRILYKLRK